MKFGIGQAIRRVEDRRFLTGHGRFVDDIQLPHMAHAAVLYAAHAHAKIRSVDTAAALAAPGVIAVLTGAEVVADGLQGLPPRFMPPALGGPEGYETRRPVLAADIVRCVGDRVAFVVAETEGQARDALELIGVDYEPLPAVTDVEKAAAAGAPVIWPDCETGNISVTVEFGDKDRTDAVFAKAPHVVKGRVWNNRLAPNAMEARACIGDYQADDDRYTLYTTSQQPHSARSIIATRIFGISETRLRVISPDVGGGFGVKADPIPEDILTLWASKRVGRPIKWTGSRSEAQLAETHARDQVYLGEVAFDDTGKILAVRAECYQALGAYFAAAAAAPLFYSQMFVPNAYDIQVLYLTNSAVFTNTPPLSVYRGAGRPEGIYFMERMLDRAARDLGIDPAEIRRRNLIKPDQLPYQTPVQHVYDSGDFVGVMEACLKLGDWDGFAARKKESEASGRLRGRAVSFFIERAGNFNERMEIRCDPGGDLTIIAGTHSHGQGHATVYAQMASDWLGVPLERIAFLQGDTDKVLFGRGTVAARSSLVGGCALKMAADNILKKATPMAAALMEAAEADIEFSDGEFRVTGTDKSMPFAQVAGAFYRPGGFTKRFGLGLEADGAWEGEPPNFPNGAHVCEVEIDPETGRVTVDRYACVDDVGVALNPMICHGQVHGGLAQGFGQALMEDVVFDPDSGQLLTGSFLDYCIPRADDFPDFNCELVEIPCTTNPLGVKGLGESGTIGAPPTLINAILDALWPLGVTDLDMPATPQRVWQAMQVAKG